MKLRWTRRAAADLRRVAQYVAEHDPAAAWRLADTLRARASGAQQFPLLGRKVPELDRDDLREFIEGNYRIVYRVLADEVRVLTVFEGHRMLQREDLGGGM